MILRREVTLGITRPVRNEHIELSPIYTEELVPVVAPDHALAARETVRARDMANEPLIIVAETVTYEYLNRLIVRGGGAPPKIPVEVEGMELARALVDGHAGVAFLPLGSILIDLESRRLVRLKLVDVPALHARVCGLRRFDAPPESKAVENLIGFLREAGARIEARGFPAERNVSAAMHDATTPSGARRRRVRTRTVHTLTT
jgi:DNA-binding transcriptional LysR family regulator